MIPQSPGLTNLGPTEKTVTVVMPCLNEAATVGQAIASFISDPAVAEILVCDGGSTDTTRDVVAQLSLRWPAVRLVDNPRRSIAAAMNVGLALAQTEFLAKIDCHAQVSADYLTRGVQHLTSRPDAHGVGGRRFGVAPGAGGQANAAALSHPFGVGGSINHYGNLVAETDHASFGVYRTEELKRVNGWDEELSVNEDVDLDHRLLADGGVLLYEPAMHIYWRNQNTLRGLFHQYRRYGRGKARMIKKNGLKAMRLSHAVAPLTVAGTAAVLGLAIKKPAALGLLAPYAVAASYCAVQASSTIHAPSLTPRIAAAFAVMHYGWGLGYLESLVAGAAPAMASLKVHQANDVDTREALVAAEDVTPTSLGLGETPKVSL